MTGIPDAVVEAAAETLWNAMRVAGDSSATWDTLHEVSKGLWRRDARDVLAAAEGPWREHLATQIREHAEYVDRGSDELPRVRSFSSGLRTAARIVQDSTEDTPPQPLQVEEPLYDYVEKKPKRGKHR